MQLNNLLEVDGAPQALWDVGATRRYTRALQTVALPVWKLQRSTWMPKRARHFAI